MESVFVVFDTSERMVYHGCDGRITIEEEFVHAIFKDYNTAVEEAKKVDGFVKEFVVG